MKTEFKSSYESAIELKKTYPNLVRVPVAAFGISHVFYADNTYSKEIAETRYNGIKNDSFVGEGVTLIIK